ncbi:MAG: hypothetical protein K2X49_11400, partial [Acetobacteraceae bacterium]|nr:hypothetical protein [Acetobacteraceae bacterium]
PAAAARLAPDSAILLAAAVRPVLERAACITLFVAPGLAAPVATRLADARIAVREDPALAAGDARAEWPGGNAVAALADRRAALAAIWAAFGLDAHRPEQQPTGNDAT